MLALNASTARSAHADAAFHNGTRSAPSACDLLDKLPAELRLSIYGYVLTGPCCLGLEKRADKELFNNSILVASRQIYSESLDVFYQHNAFCLTFRDFHDLATGTPPIRRVDRVRQLRLRKPGNTATETYEDVRQALRAIDKRPGVFPKLHTVTIEYYRTSTRIADIIGPPAGFCDDVGSLRCTSVGRHIFPLPERNLEIRFENPRSIAAWETIMASRGSLRLSAGEYDEVMFWRCWPAYETDMEPNMSRIPKCSTFSECHAFVQELSTKAVCAFAHEVDYLTSIDHGGKVGKVLEGLDEESKDALADEAPYRAYNKWSRPCFVEHCVEALTDDFDRSRRRPLLLELTAESSSEDMDAVTELLSYNVAGELMPTGVLRMMIDKRENENTELIEKRGFWWYGKPRHMLDDFGGSRVWPGIETDLSLFEE